MRRMDMNDIGTIRLLAATRGKRTRTGVRRTLARYVELAAAFNEDTTTILIIESDKWEAYSIPRTHLCETKR
jgi:hypothetical protein